MMKVCKNGGFSVKNIDANAQLECTQGEFEGAEVDIIDSDDQVEEV